MPSVAMPSGERLKIFDFTKIVLLPWRFSPETIPGYYWIAKILLVGNDPAEREVRALVIEFGGHCCKIAASLNEAAKLLREESFNLVVTDFKPNGSSPAQIAKSLKRASPELLLPALTESANTVIPEADVVLTIPCPPEKLLHRIERVLAGTAGLPRRTPVSVGILPLAAKAR